MMKFFTIDEYQIRCYHAAGHMPSCILAHETKIPNYALTVNKVLEGLGSKTQLQVHRYASISLCEFISMSACKYVITAL